MAGPFFHSQGFTCQFLAASEAQFGSLFSAYETDVYVYSSPMPMALHWRIVARKSCILT